MSVGDVVRGCIGRLVRRVGRRWLKVPIIYRGYGRYRCWEQSRRIVKEQSEYMHKAAKLGLERELGNDEVRKLLHERLARRGIRPVARKRGELHLVYASGVSPWDVANIVPGMAKFGDVETYLANERGFHDKSADWVGVRDRMNADLVEWIAGVHKRRPVDVMLAYYSGHHVSAETIEKINAMGIITAGFHLDDRLLFKGQELGGRWRGPCALAKAYDLCLTQAPESLVKYRVEGAVPLLWPLAANPDLCYPRDVPYQYDVSFVGTAYGNRLSVISYLRKDGIRVATFGDGWPAGFLPAARFQEIYCASTINLGFGEIGFTHYQTGKLRDFEVPMCGAVFLTTHNEHLGNYFDLGIEIFTFRTPHQCLEQIRRLLDDEELCRRARLLGRERALREHTWEHRVKVLLQTVGLLAA